MNPISCEPVSPIQTSAGRPGRRLKGRNPGRQARARRKTRTRSPGRTDGVDGEEDGAMTARLPARPSMLSSRLNAFVIPTSQMTPSGHAIQLLVDQLDVVPVGGRSRRRDCARASHRRQRVHVVDQPARKEQDPGKMPSEAARTPERADATAAQIPTVSPAKIPTPPKSGVGTRASARSSARRSSRRAPRWRRSLIASAEAGRAAIAARVLTSSEGRASLLGPCVSPCAPYTSCRR